MSSTLEFQELRGYDSEWSSGVDPVWLRVFHSGLGVLSRTGLRLLAFASAAGDAGQANPRRSEAVGGSEESTSEPLTTLESPEIPGCCHLALPNRVCPYTTYRWRYRCPAGWYRQWWYCLEGTRRRGCGECTRNSATCWGGPFYCSIWWWA
jgi:hypothetical protein